VNHDNSICASAFFNGLLGQQMGKAAEDAILD